MNSLDPHRLGDLFAETPRETLQPNLEDEDNGEMQVLEMENLQTTVAEVGVDVIFLMAIKNKWSLF